MCGIAGFVSSSSWTQPVDLTALRGVTDDLAAARRSGPDWPAACAALDRLRGHFDLLMSFPLFAQTLSPGAGADLLERLRCRDGGHGGNRA